MSLKFTLAASALALSISAGGAFAQDLQIEYADWWKQAPALALWMNLEREFWPAFGGPDRSTSIANALSSSRVQSLCNQLRRSAMRNGAGFHLRHPDGGFVRDLILDRRCFAAN